MKQINKKSHSVSPNKLGIKIQGKNKISTKMKSIKNILVYYHRMDEYGLHGLSSHI